MKQPIRFLLIFILSLLPSLCIGTEEISVTNPWIREAPPAAEILAAYMTISNNSRQTVQLESVASADFEMIEIHRTETRQGMSHMLKQSSLLIKSGESVLLKPGGYHLMLIKPKRNLRNGDNVTLHLHFNNGEAINVTAIVRQQ